MFKVILKRGPSRLGDRVWTHTTKRAAQQRANALAHLHGVHDIDFNDRTNTFTVDASTFYGA